eukprot:3721476-Prymnesium_polylepis.1
MAYDAPGGGVGRYARPAVPCSHAAAPVNYVTGNGRYVGQQPGTRVDPPRFMQPSGRPRGRVHCKAPRI